MSGQAPNYEFDISVVIPVYNVEEYLIECLESVNNQIKDKIQVIIIDDGSPDRSGEMADEYCKTHPNFECIHIENGGLGHARNYALQFAKGKYIAYMDSDDIIPPEMYLNMYNAAERNNCEITSCNVVRFNTSGFSESRLHANALKPINCEATHITRDYSLLYDTIACNKLIRVDFLKKHGFKFPEKMLYEDIPTTVPMHCLANKVAVVKTTAYYWRVRDGVTTSITQNISNMRNLHDRIAVMTMNNKFFAEHNMPPELYHRKLVKDLESDLIIFVNNCEHLPDDVAMEVFSHVNKYINEYITEDVLSSINLIYRQKYYHVMNNDLNGLRRLFQNQNNYYFSPVTEKDGRFYMDCADDLFTVPERDVTTAIKKTHPKTFINKFSVKGAEAGIKGHIYIPRVNIASPEEQKVQAYLLNDISGKTVPLELEYYENTNLTEKKGFVFDDYSKKAAQFNYNGTGFIIKINPEKLELTEENLGVNHLLISYENRVKSGSALLAGSSKGTEERIVGTCILEGDKLLRFNTNPYGEILVEIERLSAKMQGVTFSGTQMSVALDKPVSELYLQSNGGMVSATADQGGNYNFEVENLTSDTTYTFLYKNEKGEICNLYYAGKKSIVKRTSAGVVFISPTKDHKPDLVITPTLGVVSNAALCEESKIVNIEVAVYGKKSAMKKVKTAILCFDDAITGKLYKLSTLKVQAESGKIQATFPIDFANEKLTKNMHECFVDLKLRLVQKNKESITLPLMAKKGINLKHRHGSLKVRFHNHNKNQMKFTAWQAWSGEEETANRRSALIAEKYPEYMKLPINKRRIMFESMWGKKYSCNPQAIYEYIDKNYPEYECIWAFNDQRMPIKGNGKRVRRNSLKYYYYLATSKYLVNNVNFPDGYIKRKGQIEIQTMHGTPLKTFGLEIPGELATEKERQDFINRNARWNYLVVQGEFTATKAFDCFGVEVPIMRTGYPRTDMLYNPSEKKIAKIKKTLNIPTDKKVVFYAPTWRVMNKFDMQLDIERFRQELGDEYVLLVRIHHFSSKGYTIPADNKVIFDVNDYASIEDLYIISDMLITDYSSALFDYAITEKPMIFYLYDIKEYGGNLRGTYFDIEKEAPGPLAYNNDQLINAIKNVEKEMAACQDRCKAFNDKYVNYECGDSSRKVVEKMLCFRNSPLNRIRRIVARIRRKNAKKGK